MKKAAHASDLADPSEVELLKFEAKESDKALCKSLDKAGI